MEDGKHVVHTDDKDAHNSGTWVVISQSTQRLIGRVHQLDGEDLEKEEVAVKAVLAAKLITLKPAYDFTLLTRPVQIADKNGGPPQMAIARDPIVGPRDMTLKPFPVHCFIGPGTNIDIINQMEPDDRTTYRAYADSARETARAQSAQKNNIHVPNAREISALAKQHGRG